VDPADAPINVGLIQSGDRFYSDQPPMMAFLLSGPYWLLHEMGYRLRENSVLVPYLLTLIGVTLPAAGAAGVAYRMGRIFELRRPYRALLAMSVVMGTGLLSYAVVLNQYAPAAALVLASAGCIVQLAASKKPKRGGAWLILSGLCAALAATLEPSAILFFFLFIIVILTLRLRWILQIGGILLYLLGATPPVALHAILVMPITGDLRPGSMHPELSIFATHPRRFRVAEQLSGEITATSPATHSTDDIPDPDDTTGGTWLERIGRIVGRVCGELLGTHGVLSHFPVMVLGVAGVFAVMHRHWPSSTKTLAAIAGIAPVAGLVVLAFLPYAPDGSEFANRWMLIFLPLLLFWAGAWLRRPHQPAVWSVAGTLLGFSIFVSLIGATDPMPRAGYSQYTLGGALRTLIKPPPMTAKPSTHP
jgi:hypothetical protein